MICISICILYNGSVPILMIFKELKSACPLHKPNLNNKENVGGKRLEIRSIRILNKFKWVKSCFKDETLNSSKQRKNKICKCF